ncbi:Hypothetical_protein [Hexamita inflata]|uniref:Hypothetical_protein n=1 Tax=Hexamita inflata TaxID=28002 RepID=A0AA86NX27_9EUKA|nr:Hypothetical protein HINF_LOCUS15445 [Hexamita inflata]
MYYSRSVFHFHFEMWKAVYLGFTKFEINRKRHIYFSKVFSLHQECKQRSVQLIQFGTVSPAMYKNYTIRVSQIQSKAQILLNKGIITNSQKKLLEMTTILVYDALIFGGIDYYMYQTKYKINEFVM